MWEEGRPTDSADHIHQASVGRPRGRVTLFNGLYEEAPPEYLFRLQVFFSVLYLVVKEVPFTNERYTKWVACL